MQRPEYTHLSNQANDAGHAPGALQQRLQGLARQTAYKLTENELREWAKILMGKHATSTVSHAAPGLSLAARVMHGVNKETTKGLAKKAGIAAIGIGIGYYLLTRRH